MRLFFNISGANLTKIFDLRVTKMLKKQFYTENMLYIRCFYHFLLNFPVLRNDLYTDIFTELVA